MTIPLPSKTRLSGSFVSQEVLLGLLYFKLGIAYLSLAFESLEESSTDPRKTESSFTIGIVGSSQSN